MKIFGVSVMVLAATAQTMAMPTRAELSKVQPMVVELMAPALEEYKSAADKVAGAVKVGDSSCAFAAEAETEAAKFLLLKGAVSYYVRGEAYDKAADCIATMQADIDNLTPDVVAEIVGKATSRISESKAPRLIAYYRAAKLQIRARKELPVLEKKLRRAKSEQLQRQYAEALAISGNWKAAYAAFAKSCDKDIVQITEAEAKGIAANEQTAELWWNYKPEFEGVGNFFKVHAVEFYQKALDNGEISGLKKNIVERRIAQINEEAAAHAVAKTSDVSHGGDAAAGQFKTKMIDLGGGMKMEMIYVVPGSFMMGSDNGEKTHPVHKVILTKGFWLGKYEVTQKQWKQVMSGNPSKFNGDDRPVENVSWDDCQEFIRKVNVKLGGERARLPTEAEWEYACRAGTTGDFGGTGRIDDMGWYKENSGGTTHSVGQKQANAWGFHDMHGNVFEWCIDGFDSYSEGLVTDPVGRSSKKVLRGGCRYLDEKSCSSGFRIAQITSYSGGGVGFRLCMNADGVASDRSNVATAASDKAPDARATKPMAIKLGDGQDVELLPCPAGTYTMGNSSKGSFLAHKVTISRSFWMSKYPLTYAQAKAITGKACDEKNKWGDPPFPWDALGGDKTPVGMAPQQALDLIETMNVKYASRLPKGYVFRFPTEAEWEYALLGGKKKHWDGATYKRRAILVEERQKAMEGKGLTVRDFEKFPWVLPNVAVGTKAANDWGFHDMIGNGWEYTLDIVKGDSDKLLSIDDDILGGLYKDGDVDPLTYCDGPNKRLVMRGSGWGEAKLNGKIHKKALFSSKEIFHSDAHIRLVIGPDLVAEKMAKNGKK